ncbi:MAG: type II secretion system ATPase GspE [Deltaproteobacteria bacterium]|nr:type II secretion system ATPase GspE [Deltaproteobacteria bacterium]MBI2501264.1 type II secretion system ATPase GspE [Deltaproteobacteria bacterium]
MIEDRSLGAILLENTSLTQQQLDEALTLQRDKGIKLGEALVQLKFLRNEDILKALSIQLGIPYEVKLEPDSIATDLASTVSLNYAKKNEVMPIRREDHAIVVAMSDPLNHYVVDDLRVLYGSAVRPVIASSLEIMGAINSVFNRMSDVGDHAAEELEGENLDTLGQELEEVQDLLDSADEAPIIRLVNSLIFRAVKQKASDIHFEPFEKELIVRFRVDGTLYDIMRPPKRVQAAVTSRLKVMASLDIAEKRLPQDGRIRLKIAGKDIDVRVSTVPTAQGESIVLRLLDRSSVMVDLDRLGMAPLLLKKFNEVLDRTHGIILVTGPTGSGKTTTLYAALSKLNTPDVKIITTEDPVEYQLQGINQIPVNAKINLTFAAGLRSILRQDPDIVMVGEIRDKETAEIAVQAALTGHLVFSTLHTNDSASSVTRMIDMGVEPFLISSSVLAILAQRLIRRVCLDCGKKYVPTPEELVRVGIKPEDLKGRQLYRAVGCPNCMNTGYAGRVGIHELLIMDEEMRGLVVKNPDATVLKRKAMSKGMATLREDALQKALKGMTTLEEVLLSTQEDVMREEAAV